MIGVFGLFKMGIDPFFRERCRGVFLHCAAPEPDTG